MSDEEIFNLSPEALQKIKDNRTEAYIHTGEYENMLDWEDLTPHEQRLAAEYFKD